MLRYFDFPGFSFFSFHVKHRRVFTKRYADRRQKSAYWRSRRF